MDGHHLPGITTLGESDPGSMTDHAPRARVCRNTETGADDKHH